VFDGTSTITQGKCRTGHDDGGAVWGSLGKAPGVKKEFGVSDQGRSPLFRTTVEGGM